MVTYVFRDMEIILFTFAQKFRISWFVMCTLMSWLKFLVVYLNFNANKFLTKPRLTSMQLCVFTEKELWKSWLYPCLGQKLAESPGDANQHIFINSGEVIYGGCRDEHRYLCVKKIKLVLKIYTVDYGIIWKVFINLALLNKK